MWKQVENIMLKKDSNGVGVGLKRKELPNPNECGPDPCFK